MAIHKVKIEDELVSSYLSYSLSVIIGRAIPDIRDGLKPVQRRIIWTMWEENITSNSQHRKSAKIVGSCIGKYHPHGDKPVYDALVRMAQDFVMRYPLIDGQGNFGSIDGDEPAAMRYCVTGDTLILTDRGCIPIEKIANGQEVEIDLDVLNYKGEVVKATKFFDSGEHTVIKITTSFGYELKGSINHPVLCWVKNGEGFPTLMWKMLKDVAPGDYVALMRNFSLFARELPKLTQYHPKDDDEHTKLPDTVSEELAFFMGALLSRGKFEQNEIIFSFIGEDIRLYETLKSVIENLFGKINIHERKTEENRLELIIRNQKIIRFLENLGLAKPGEKEVPLIILQSPKNIIAKFLQVLFEFDGEVISPDKVVVYTSESEKLIKQLKVLLLNFGIVTINKDNGKLLLISGRENILRFRKEIGFWSEEKQKLLPENIVYDKVDFDGFGRTDFIPYLSEYLRKNYNDELIQKDNLNLYSRLEESFDVLKDTLKPHDVAIIKFLLEHRFFFDRVVSKEKLREKQKVYSVKVNTDCHSFVANGFINHNTEARLTPIAHELLEDIEEGTVEFSPNYDETLEEPKYLPAKFPNLLVNGSSGIAVGMSTSIPPHNITEVIDALIYLLEKPKSTLDDILKIIKGPDFPTGGMVLGDFKQVYEEGKGQFTIYARYKVEKGEKGRKNIVFYEVPYQENKSKIVEKIAQLARDKVIDGVVRVADESDRKGIRIVVEVKEGFDIEPIVAQIYEKTGLKSNFFVNMLVVDGVQPISVDLMTILRRFIDFRKEIVLRRTRFRLEKAERHLHILEGYMKALSSIDEVISIIRNSENQQEAKQKLMKRFSLSDVQAQAILDLKLGRLSKLDAEEIKRDYDKTMKEVQNLKEIITSEERLREVIRGEFEEIKKKYGDQRKTEISEKPPVSEEIGQEYKIVITYDFYINVFAKTERVPRLPVKSGFISSGDLACVSNLGKVYRVRFEKIKSWTEKGMPVKSLVRMSKDEEIIYVCPAYEDKYLVFITKKGFTKKFRLSEVYDLTARGEVIFELEEGDEIRDAVECSEEDDIFFITKGGMILGVRASDITSRVSKAIELSRGDVLDEVLAVIAKTREDKLLICATENYVKAVKASHLKVQSKGGVGISLFPEKAGNVVDAIFVSSGDDTVAITYVANEKVNYKYFPAKKIPVLTRQAIGKKIVEGKIISLGKVP